MAPRNVVRLDLAYDGTDFRGWAAQRDPAVRTVEGELARNLERVLRERPRLSVAGRTDAGVHARGQVASFVAERTLDPERIRAALNGRLAPEVVVLAASLAPGGFDARTSATERRYRYTIDLAAVPDPFTARFVWHRPGALAVARMRIAAWDLLGEHDFTSFCRHPGGNRSTVREVRGVSIVRRDRHLEIAIRANAFLQQMVRSIVGTLVAVGEGRIDAEDMPGILAARDRAAAGPVAPARGLVLDRVVYGRRAFRALTGSRSRR